MSLELISVNESEADYLFDIEPDYDMDQIPYDEDAEYRRAGGANILHRKLSGNTVYAIEGISPFGGYPIYLQSKKVRGGQKWTKFRNNARWFNTKEEAQKICDMLKFNCPHIIPIRSV